MPDKRRPEHSSFAKESRAERFTEYYPPYSRSEASTEANRCLFCYDAPCIVACPTHIDIPTFIKKIATENIRGSARTILEANLLGATCARVCPVEELCEGSCVLNADEKPITIGRLQRYAMDFAAKDKLRFFDKGKSNGLRVAIVGAGPAGLSCAGELAKRGFAVTCYERKPLSGGLDTYGIVVFREPVQVSLSEVGMIEELGVEIRNNVEVGSDLSLSQLLEEFDAVFIAIGLGNVPSLKLPGEELSGVIDGLEFIEKTKTMDINSIECGSRVCIIGAGNTAIDCATIARRLGAPEVTILYRRSRTEIPSYDFEYEFALKEGVKFQFLTLPTKVIGNGKVEGLSCRRVKLGAPDESGRAQPQPIQNSDFDLPCDMVITAIGQKKHQRFLDELAQLRVKIKDGYVDVDAKTNRTAHQKIFAGGDCIRAKGHASTVMAVQDGKIACEGIIAQLTSKNTNGKRD